jgi:hypothetical protein
MVGTPPRQRAEGFSERPLSGRVAAIGRHGACTFDARTMMRERVIARV